MQTLRSRAASPRLWAQAALDAGLFHGGPGVAQPGGPHPGPFRAWRFRLPSPALASSLSSVGNQ